MQEFCKDLDYINTRFSYCPDSGVLVWKKRNDVPKWWNTRYAGTSPCNKDSLGYIRAKITRTVNGKKTSSYVSVHRICFFMVHGWLPECVDHKNGNIEDNRIENLRASDFKTNTWNRGPNKGTFTGYKGVSAVKRSSGPRKGEISGYTTSLGHNGKRLYLGYFKTAEEAHRAVREKEIELRSEWVRKVD